MYITEQFIHILDQKLKLWIDIGNFWSAQKQNLVRKIRLLEKRAVFDVIVFLSHWGAAYTYRKRQASKQKICNEGGFLSDKNKLCLGQEGKVHSKYKFYD